jgi:hypothetical protein
MTNDDGFTYCLQFQFRYQKMCMNWWAGKIALLSQEGSGIAKRIPRGVVPKPPACSMVAQEPPRPAFS